MIRKPVQRSKLRACVTNWGLRRYRKGIPKEGGSNNLGSHLDQYNRMKQVELFIPSVRIEDHSGLSLEEIIAGLQDTSNKRAITYFDELLVGYALVNKVSDEVIDRMTLDIHFKDTKGQHQVFNLATLPLDMIIVTNEDKTQLLYKFELFTAFPKVKLEEPILKFKLQAVLKLVEKNKEAIEQQVKSLPSYYPAERRNLLEGLNHSLSETDDVVLLDSLIKNNQVQIDTEELTEVKSTLRELSDELEVPIIRTLNIRIRNIRLRNNIILSTIDIQKGSKCKEFKLPVSVNKLDFKHNQNFSFKPKFSSNNHKLPINISQQDSYSYTYQLHLDNEDQAPNFKSLVEVGYTVDAIYQMKTVLITNIDFNSIPQLKRGSNLSLPSLSNSPNVNSISQSLAQSLTVKFTGNKIVKLGVPFKLKVHIQNNSVKERNLLMVFNSNQNHDFFTPNLPKVKTLVQSNHSILKNYSSLRVKNIGIISLVNEVQFKIKPKDIHDTSNINIFENEIELVALELGVFNLQGVRLVDMTSGESIPCDRLLELIVES